MKRTVLGAWGVGLAGGLVVLACSAPPATDREPQVIHAGYSGEPDFGDLPSFIAHDRLKAMGYRIERTHFAAPDVAIEGLARGTVDIGHGSMIGAWKAAARGAHIRTIMDHLENPYRLIAGPDVKRCADLNGRRLAIPATSAVSTQLVRAYMDEECPGAKPHVLSVLESSSRAAAFLNGGVDAGSLELSSMLWLFSQAPDRFTLLSDFATRWPGIKTTGVHVNTDFAAAHTDAVRDYVRMLLAVNRDVLRDPSLLVSKAEQELGRTEDWSAAARAYVNEHVWPSDGGLSARDVDDTLKFFKTYSELDPQATPGTVVDLRFLGEALADSER